MPADLLQTLHSELHNHLSGLVAAVPKLLLAFLVWAIAIKLAKSLSNLAEKWLIRKIESRRRAMVSRLLARVIFTILLIMGILIGLSVLVPSFGLKDFLSFLGLSGVAIGLAFSNVLQSFFAGVIIALSGTFGEGDSVEMGDIKGKVEEIQLRATILLGDGGERILVPNGLILTTAVRVTAFEGERREELLVTVPSNTDLEALISNVVEQIKTLPLVSKNAEPTVFVKQIESDKIQLLARWWIKGEWGSGTKTRAKVAVIVRNQLALKT